MYQYITVEESQSINYFRIPKQLFSDEFKDLSTDAKLLYGLMLERTGLSKKNNWVNESGYVYIIFTLDEVQQELGCSNKSVIKYMNELEIAGLLEKKRQGLGKPNLLFVKSLMNKVHFKKCKKVSSRSEENTSLEVKKVHGINTDISNTNNSNKEKTNKKESFEKPTLQEVIDYCNERNNTIDPQAFIDFYESKGWMIGSNKMRDWQAAIRTWERNRKMPTRSPVNEAKKVQYTVLEPTREITDEEWEHIQNGGTIDFSN